MFVFICVCVHLFGQKPVKEITFNLDIWRASNSS